MSPGVRQPAGGGGVRRGVGICAVESHAAGGDAAWGWRIPLIVGCLIIPFIYMIRRTLQGDRRIRGARTPPQPGRSLSAVYWPIGGL